MEPLDFSGALAAIGLVFAVYQLRKPSWDVVLRLRPWWQRYLFLGFAAAGFALTLFAVVLEKTLPNWPLSLGDPLPYQIAAYIVFAASPTSLLWFAERKRGLFTRRNSKRFYLVLAWSAATTSERSAILDVLLTNFREICQFAMNPAAGDGHDYAKAVLDVILSDADITKELTTKQLAGLNHVFLCAEKFGLSRYNCPIGIPALVRNLYLDAESFLYKQYRADGLAQAMNIYETVFGSARLLSNFEFFHYPSIDYTSRSAIASRGVDVFIEALTRAIKTYLTSPHVPPQHINRGIEYLSEILGDQCYTVNSDRNPQEGASRTPAWEAINRIVHFAGHDFGFIVDLKDWNEGVRQREFATTEADFDSQVSISSAIAELIASAFSQLATIDKNKDIFRSYQATIDLIHGLMYQGDVSATYGNAFNDAIWERIHENIIRRFYPATLRVYLEFMGFLLVFNRGSQGLWADEQCERMRRLLYVDVKPLFDRGEKMINDELMQDALLPKVMRYANGTFYYTGRYGEGDESEIKAPPRDSESALKGVKDRFSR